MADHRAPLVTLRVARPVRDLPAALHFYVHILGLAHLGGFEGHDGYDGAFVGQEGADWQLEFTRHASGLPLPGATEEDLLVFYLGKQQLEVWMTRLHEFGCSPVAHPNPYWTKAGAVTYRDPDGYRLILCPNGASPPP
jgi:catechol 2,3-dioxygenase-like lactoylglutathione lyase family enzyme